MILGLMEHDRGHMPETSRQMLTAARKIAEATGQGLAAVLIGEEARPLIDDLKTLGVGRVILAGHEKLTDYAPEAWAAVLLGIMESHDPMIVLAPSTDRGNEVMAHLASRADLPLASNCSEVHPGDPFRVVRLRWGGSLLEEADLNGSPRLLTLAPHFVEPEEAPIPGEFVIEEFTPNLEDKDFRAGVAGREEAVAPGVSLKTARVVIGGGRGVGSPEGYAVLEDLAGLLGAAVGGSRVATNNGWRPHADQIGLTGNRIAPELYIACGISGAIQHLVGCKGAKHILVINNDPEAAFFSKADYGVVGDLLEIVPAITAEVKKAGG